MKIPKLALDYASRFNLDPAFVQGVARYLREAGLLSQGARGVNAPDAGARDAARLLIPFMVGGVAMKAKDAPDVVRDFGALVHANTQRRDPETGEIAAAPSEPVPGATLEQGITAIIEGMQDKEMRQSLLSEAGLYSGVFIQDTLMTAKIVCADLTFHYVHPLWLEWARSEGVQPDGAITYPEALQAAKRRYGSCILGERQIDLWQLHTISEVLHGNIPAGSNTLPNDRAMDDHQ